MPAFDPPNPVRSARHTSVGFTILEIVVVMVLMSIILAVVLGRSITTTDVDVASQTDKIRNHLRYAQSVAMKRSDSVWGIQFSGTEYWFFRIGQSGTEEIQLPGGEYSGGSTRISLSDLGVGISIAGLGANDSVIFDGIGKPYTRYVDAADNDPLAAQAALTVSDAGKSRDIQITPETGFIQ